MSIQIYSRGPSACAVMRASPLTGTVGTMELPVSLERVEAYVTGMDPRLAQLQLPELSADQREFLMTGYTPEDWAVMFPPEPSADRVDGYDRDDLGESPDY